MLTLNQTSLADLEALCKKWNIIRLSLFGSELTDRFTDQSDVDLVVGFDPSDRSGLFAFARMEEEFVHYFGRKVDLITERALRDMRNPYRKQAIESTMRPIYVA